MNKRKLAHVQAEDNPSDEGITESKKIANNCDSELADTLLILGQSADQDENKIIPFGKNCHKAKRLKTAIIDASNRSETKRSGKLSMSLVPASAPILKLNENKKNEKDNQKVLMPPPLPRSPYEMKIARMLAVMRTSLLTKKAQNLTLRKINPQTKASKTAKEVAANEVANKSTESVKAIPGLAALMAPPLLLPNPVVRPVPQPIIAALENPRLNPSLDASSGLYKTPFRSPLSFPSHLSLHDAPSSNSAATSQCTTATETRYIPGAEAMDSSPPSICQSDSFTATLPIAHNEETTEAAQKTAKATESKKATPLSRKPDGEKSTTDEGTRLSPSAIVSASTEVLKVFQKILDERVSYFQNIGTNLQDITNCCFQSASGATVGVAIGAPIGAPVGVAVGVAVGAPVGAPMPAQNWNGLTLEGESELGAQGSNAKIADESVDKRDNIAKSTNTASNAQNRRDGTNVISAVGVAGLTKNIDHSFFIGLSPNNELTIGINEDKKASFTEAAEANLVFIYYWYSKITNITIILVDFIKRLLPQVSPDLITHFAKNSAFRMGANLAVKDALKLLCGPSVAKKILYASLSMVDLLRHCNFQTQKQCNEEIAKSAIHALLITRVIKPSLLDCCYDAVFISDKSNLICRNL